MKTYIYEIGVIDKEGNKHPVRFKEGLNIITGKSSTGKSAIIEIFDYCFGGEDNTVPDGVITKKASIYYVYMNINGECVVLGRDPENSRGFYKIEKEYNSDIIKRSYFDLKHFIPNGEYKRQIRSHFIDIADVDTSLIVKGYRGKASPTPSIRSFTTFMLQHQNLVANKHALFYRFDEKEKREQVIDHTKIFLGFVNQEFFHLSQERERLEGQEKSIQLEIQRNKKLIEKEKEKIEPLLLGLYASMGLAEFPINIDTLMDMAPQVAIDKLDELVKPEGIEPLSDAMTQRQINLEKTLAAKTSELRSLQRKIVSIKKTLNDSNNFSFPSDDFLLNETVQIANTNCPFCNTENSKLHESAENLKFAINKLSNDVGQSKVMKAKLESFSMDYNRNIERLTDDITNLEAQLTAINSENTELKNKRTLYETVISNKERLIILLDSLTASADEDSDEKLNVIRKELKTIKEKLSKYDYNKKLAEASKAVNSYMADIGQHFDFEDSYKPINLHFSFDTFDLYHLDKGGKKIYLRSMGSGANWLYCHITLFLALHKYFASLKSVCAIPTVLFLDQPTQVYFPSFQFDDGISFSPEKIAELEKRGEDERPVDEDVLAVENLFSQLSIYCTQVGEETGITPQLIVSDHADNLKLSDSTNFEDHVNGNRWRDRGLINPI